MAASPDDAALAHPPTARASTRGGAIALVVVLALGAGAFIVGIPWGLPSTRNDAVLFGGRVIWSGERIAELSHSAERWDRQRGADVDVDPLADRTTPVLINADEEQLAAILRRYRLFTAQPDEMITMMALASMRPGDGDFDPKLYQYGGLFVYPIGAALAAASRTGALTLTGDVSYYLDHPEAFARFYIVARAFVVLYGLIGVLAVYALGRRVTAALAGGAPIGGGRVALGGVVAAGLYVAMPVVVTMAHEAKPHLPGAVLMVLAVLAAARYVEGGRWRWALCAGTLCGAAFGTVLSTLPIFVVLPVMAWRRPGPAERRVRQAVAACAVGGLVYVLSNPYIVINAFVNRAVLASNFGNSIAMYAVDRFGAGFVNVVRLMAVGTGVGPLVVGVVVAALHGGRAARRASEARSQPVGSGSPRAILWLLGVPSLLLFVQFVALGAGKPGEYARFALFPDIAIATVAAGLVAMVRSVRVVSVLAGVLFVQTAMLGALALRDFVADVRGTDTRAQCRDAVQAIGDRDGPVSIGVFVEPAPYCLPPVNLFDNRLVVLPPRATPATLADVPDVVLAPVDDMSGAPLDAWAADPRYRRVAPKDRSLDSTYIGWANRPFVLLVRRGIGPAEENDPDAR